MLSRDDSGVKDKSFQINSSDSSKRQMKSSVHYMIYFATIGAIPILTLPIFSRILSPAEYGTLALANIIGGFVAGLANFGMSIAFDRNFFQYQKIKSRISELLYSNLAFVFINFTVLLSITMVFSESISLIFIRSHGHGFLITIVVIDRFLNLVFNSFGLAYLKNTEKSGIYLRYGLVFAISNAIAGIVLVAGARVGVVGIPVADLAASAVVGCVILIHEAPRPVRFSFKLFKESLRIAFPLTPTIFVGVLNTQVEKYLLGILQSVGVVGVYDIGRRLSEMGFTFMTALQNVFIPQLYKRLFDKKEETRSSIPEYLLPFLYISLFFTMLIALFGEEALRILVPPSYYSAIPIVSILSIYYGILFFSKITAIQLIYSKKTVLTSSLTILGVAGNIILGIPLIRAFGGIGAALATLGTGIVTTVLSLIMAHKACAIKWRISRIAPLLLLFIVGPTSVLTLWAFSASYWVVLLVKITIVGLFLFSGNKLGIVRRESLRLFIEILRGHRDMDKSSMDAIP